MHFIVLIFPTRNDRRSLRGAGDRAHTAARRHAERSHVHLGQRLADRDTTPGSVDIDRCGMESEPVHEPAALPHPGPMDGGLLATPGDADRDRW